MPPAVASACIDDCRPEGRGARPGTCDDGMAVTWEGGEAEPVGPATVGREALDLVRGRGPDAGKAVRGLHEEANPRHRLRVEHDPHTLLVHLSDEDGAGWTTIAVDRATRRWEVAQTSRQSDAARDAYERLYDG